MEFKKIRKSNLFDDYIEDDYDDLYRNDFYYSQNNSTQIDNQRKQGYYENQFHDIGQYYNQHLDPMFLALMSIINNRQPYIPSQTFIPNQPLNNYQYDVNEVGKIMDNINNINSRISQIERSINHLYNKRNNINVTYHNDENFNKNNDRHNEKDYNDEYYDDQIDNNEYYSDGREEYYMDDENYKEFMNILKNDVKNSENM